MSMWGTTVYTVPLLYIGHTEVITTGEHASRATYQMAYVIGRVLNGGTLIGQ